MSSTSQHPESLSALEEKDEQIVGFLAAKWKTPRTEVLRLFENGGDRDV